MGRLPVTGAAERRRLLTARTTRLVGSADEARERLAETSVLVVGAGGLGSPVISLLAGSGIGRLTIVDPDVVDPTNLARQTLFGAADVGRPKAVQAAARASAVDPDLVVDAIVDRFHPSMVDGHDVVLDAADSLAVTRLVSDACADAGIPWVWGAVLAFDGQVATFWDRRGIDFHDLHGGTSADDGADCAIAGVLPSLCHAVGSVMAAQVLALTASIGEPLLGAVLTVDASTWEWTRSAIRRGPGNRRPAPVARITAADLAALLPTGSVTVVDVRTPEERDSGMIPAAVAADDVPPTSGDVVVVCERGPRADAWAVANPARLSGRIRVLDGGMAAWRTLGRHS